MKINSLKVNNWCILKDFEVHFEKNLSVLIGENGSGKSTVLELVALIFGHLYKYYVEDDRDAGFIEGYTINFTSSVLRNDIMTTYNVEIESVSYQEEDEDDGVFNHKIKIDNKRYSKRQANAFLSDIGGFKTLLPSSIVLYYAGVSTHLEELSNYFEKKYESRVIKANNTYTIKPLNLPKERPFFYCRTRHLSSILLCLIISENETHKQLISKLGINPLDIEVLFKIKKPVWYRNSDSSNFWGASDGAIKEFLSILSTKSFKSSYKADKIRFQYLSDLSVKDMLKSFSVENGELFLFKMLDLLMFNDLIDDIDISWKNWRNGDTIEIGRLSEGEKQLILTTGLVELWNIENSLMLLDEPDTFLHPKWQAEFIPILSENLKGNQAIITTHSPSLISDISKQQLIGLENGRTINFSFNPYGKTVEDVLLDFFNVESVRSSSVNNKINILRQLVMDNKYESQEFKDLFSIMKKEIDSEDKDIINIQFEVEQRKLFNR